MQYLYFPGCSLESSALEYNVSTQAILASAGIRLKELSDWTCCGATAAQGVSKLLSLVLPARNLALAEKMHPGLDILAPCSACYLNLKKVEVHIQSNPRLLYEINAVLAQENLTLTGINRVKHLLEVLSKDIGPKVLTTKVIHPLKGLNVAPYYGCQCLRPFAVFDDPEAPRAMEGLLIAAGADIFDWSMGPKCCGASHMNTKMDVGLTLCSAILSAAQGADAIATVCPMCQLNLEGYQNKISRLQSKPIHISIMYLPQLLGLSMGLNKEELKINLNLSITESLNDNINRRFVERISTVPP
jgi:heterodisulfide reductase subunit B